MRSPMGWILAGFLVLALSGCAGWTVEKKQKTYGYAQAVITGGLATLEMKKPEAVQKVVSISRKAITAIRAISGEEIKIGAVVQAILDAVPVEDEQTKRLVQIWVGVLAPIADEYAIKLPDGKPDAFTRTDLIEILDRADAVLDIFEKKKGEQTFRYYPWPDLRLAYAW